MPSPGQRAGRAAKPVFVALLAGAVLAVSASPVAAAPAGGPPIQLTATNPPRQAAAADAPVITGFSAPGGDIGSSITVQGTGFAPDPAADQVTINGVTATVTAADASSVTFIIPQDTGSGFVSVTTPDGTAVSANHLVVPPRGLAYADISSTGVLGVDAPDVVARVDAAKKTSLLRLDTTPGQRLAFGFATPTIPSILKVIVYGPNGLVLHNSDGTDAVYQISRSGGQFLMPPLAAGGTLSMLIDPTSDSATGTVNVSSPSIVDGGPITTTGGPATLTFTKPYQQVVRTFSATAGQQLAFANHDWAIPGSGQTVISVYGPDHRKLTWMVASSRLQVLPFTAPVTGDYEVVGVMDTLGGGSPLGSYKLTLSERLDSGTIDVGGTPKPLTIARYGQQQKITFTGRVGQLLGFGFTDAKNVQFAPSLTVTSPSGVKVWDLFSAMDNEVTDPLPEDGTYTVVLNPFATTGSYTMWLSEDIEGGTLVPDSPARPITVPRPGQNVRFTIPGTAGEHLGLAMLHPWSFGLIGTVTTPRGSELVSRGVRNTMDIPALPEAGDYRLFADLGAVSGTATFHLTNDVQAGAVTVGGDALTVGITRPGQNARGTFDGVAGQRVGLGLYDNTLTGQYRLRVYAPNGTEVPGSFLDIQSGVRDDKEVVLPAAGRYEFELDPVDDNIGTGQLKVLATTAFDGGSVNPGGPPAQLTLPRIGQDGTFTFTGTAGQKLALRFTENQLNNSSGTIGKSNFYLTVLGPDGRALSGLDYKLKSDNADVTLPTLSAAGTYTVLVDPDRGGTGSIKTGILAVA